jgi:hypothetical protein
VVLILTYKLPLNFPVRMVFSKDSLGASAGAVHKGNRDQVQKNSLCRLTNLSASEEEAIGFKHTQLQEVIGLKPVEQVEGEHREWNKQIDVNHA